MHKRCIKSGLLAVMVLALTVLSASAYADDNSQFNQFVQSLHAHRLKVEQELQLTDRVRHATGYYGSYEYHYELEQIGLDDIANSVLK